MNLSNASQLEELQTDTNNLLTSLTAARTERRNIPPALKSKDARKLQIKVNENGDRRPILASFQRNNEEGTTPSTSPNEIRIFRSESSANKADIGARLQ